MTENPEAPTDLDVYDPGDIEDDDLFMGGRSERGDGEFEYPLTSFVPKVDPSKDGRSIPDGAVRWIIPDLSAVEYLRVVKIFKSTFVDKIPPGYNLLFVRVDRRTKEPDPTPLQERILKTVVSKFPGADGMPKIGQSAFLPVYLSREEGWKPVIAEMTISAYDAIVEANALMEDATNGTMSLATRPVAVWKPKGGDNRAVFARIEKKMAPGSYADATAEEPLDLREYVRVRRVATENWWAAAWRIHDAGGDLGESTDEPSDTERFVDAALDLDSGQLRSVLKASGVDLGSARSKSALVQLTTENMSTGTVFDDVMAVHKLLTSADEDADTNVPF